jgi:hypothetical protein
MSEICGYSKSNTLNGKIFIEVVPLNVCVLSHITHASGSDISTVDFEGPTSRGFTLHQEEENEGWFSCVRDPISIFGGGKLWLVGVRKTSNSYVLLQLQLLRV